MSSIPDRLTAALADRYRIERPLGEGGMATVYLAEDIKHERKVALKVLKPELAAVIGAERFVTEIKTTAAMQHPHILPLFDSGEADGFLYYVMPYIEGESLREKLDREKQLSIDEAVHIAEAVASALHYAHERGIVHRDIKPANILLHAGQPVVADFGIALAVSAAGGGRLTETGLSVGTPYYMSPEQATADRDVTARSDIYSLACVLYEMLAGDPPHSGSNAQAVLMRILTEEARPITDVRKSVPPNVRCVIEKGLEKLPADRFESAEEFGRALADPRYGDWGPPGMVSAAAAGQNAAGLGRARLVALGAIPAMLVGVALGRGWVAGESAGSADLPVHATLEAVDGLSSMSVSAGPDGSIVFPRRVGETGRETVRRYMDRPEPLVYEGEVGNGVFSPDGQWFAFRGIGGVGRIPANGGSSIDLWTPEGAGLRAVTPSSWSPEGWIYATAFRVSGGTAILRIREDGSSFERLMDFAESARHVEVLPGDRAALVAIAPSMFVYDTTRVVTLDFESGDTASVLPAAAHPAWSPTGHVVFMDPTSEIFALPFDATTRASLGPPIPLGIRTGRWDSGRQRFDLADNGVLAYLFDEGERDWEDRWVLLDPESGEREALASGQTVGTGELSPDGIYLATTALDEIVVTHLDRGAQRRIELADPELTYFSSVRWSPSGDSLLITSDDGLWVVELDSGESRNVMPGDRSLRAAGWLPSGEVLAQTGQHRSEDIVAVDIRAGTMRPLLDAPNWSEQGPRISPDGRWLAYESDRTGAPEIYIRTFPELLNETMISVASDSIDGFSSLEWAPGGAGLMITGGRGTPLVTAWLDLSGQSARVIGRDTLPAAPGEIAGVARDGRIVFRERSGSFDGNGRTEVRIVTDFRDRLRRLGGN